MSEPASAAGWYADPDEPAQQRWWDGTAFTDAHQPAPADGVSADADAAPDDATDIAAEPARHLKLVPALPTSPEDLVVTPTADELPSDEADDDAEPQLARLARVDDWYRRHVHHRRHLGRLALIGLAAIALGGLLVAAALQPRAATTRPDTIARIDTATTTYLQRRAACAASAGLSSGACANSALALLASSVAATDHGQVVQTPRGVRIEIPAAGQKAWLTRTIDATQVVDACASGAHGCHAGSTPVENFTAHDAGVNPLDPGATGSGG